MPVLIDRGRTVTFSAGTMNLCSTGVNDAAESIRIALINNMPDPALEDTEHQFFELLEAASDDIPVRVTLFSLPEVPREARGKQRLSDFYSGMDELWNSQFDAAIITGTEPRQPDLRKESFWRTFTNVIDWAEENTASTVLSCLAAHAGVLYSDGIERHPLMDKQFGVFEYEKACDHPLTEGVAKQICIPHSRWNEVKQDALASCGYLVLTKSANAGADLFVKRKKGSLFVHFQGHPEYGELTLLKEYRRDIKRFIRRERETYPSMPRGYFNAIASKLLSDFREKVQLHQCELLMKEFPEAAVSDSLQTTWRPSAVSVYRNWLQYLAFRKASASECALMTRIAHG
jgi:homoserine O-succinyltransferase/O-acetyltransferase